jgi:uncharacterized damage-inducible protein DinB
MNAEDIRNLFEYNAWANHRSLEAAAALTPEQFTRDLGSSFKSVRDTLAHIAAAEWIWLERFHGRSPSGFPPGLDSVDHAGLVARWAELERDWTDFAASLSDADLARVYAFKTMKGDPQEQPAWQMLQHLVNHGSYHRGQVTTLLRQLGANPLNVDMIGFYRQRAAKAKA